MENKAERMNFRVTENFKVSFQKLAHNKTMSESDLLEYLFVFFKENSEKNFLNIANEITDKVSDSIEKLENIRDYSDRELTNKENQFYKALSLCYDILIKTELILTDHENTVQVPTEMLEEGDEPTRYRHAMLADTTADNILKNLL
jgi:hypothetical protein